jgi:diaminopimelate epimerase
LVNGLKDFDVRKEGAKLRYGLYGEQGSNINFVDQATEDTFNVRTYERGVEDETFSCGTGVTAVALAMHYSGKTNKDFVKIITPGGNLQVKFNCNADGYDQIWLIGPAQLVFKGEINVES